MLDPQRLRIVMTDDPTEVSVEFVRDQLYLSVSTEDDEGEHHPVTLDELVASGMTEEQALDMARANLRGSSSRTDVRKVDTLPGLLFVKCADGLAASRLAILPDLLHPLPLGGVIAAVPELGQLLCVPLESARSIDAMQALASAVGHLEATRDYLLSDQLFWYDGARWRPVPVHHGEEDITVLPPPDFLRTMSHVAAMDLVSIAGEA